MDYEQFAHSRGFEPEELDRWGIYIEDDLVIIPVLGRNGVWYEREHRPGGSPKYRPRAGLKDVGNHLYNPLGLGPGSPVVWIAEGEFDTLSLVTVGAPALGVLGATTFQEHWSLLYSHAKVVIALDPDTESDQQGTAVLHLAQLWPEAQVSRFDPMAQGGYPDLNDWFKADRRGFQEVVESWPT